MADGKMNKKGQIQEIFVWIFVLIVAASILFFGIKMIYKTNDLQDEVLVIKFFNDFDKKLGQYYYLDKGSKGKEEFLLPTNAKYVCFLNETGPITNWIDIVENKDRVLITDLEDYSNVFVGPLNLYNENRFNLSNSFTTDNVNPLCVKVNGGMLKINLENLGAKNGVKISG